VAAGQTHSVREFCELTLARVGLDYREFVAPDGGFYRPAEVDLLMGDAAKARAVLEWPPQHTFPQLVEEMVDTDLQCLASCGPVKPEKTTLLRDDELSIAQAGQH
jgi:GDPmannose 4,6-dehydratase